LDTAQWKEVRDLFQNAIDLPEAERETYVHSRTSDETIRRVTLEMLADEKPPAAGGDAPLEQPWEAAIRGIAREVIHEHDSSRQVRSSGNTTLSGKPSAAPYVPQSGEQIGHYVIERPLGKGGMGQVLLARDARLDRPVAVKFLTASAGKFDSKSRPVFEREVKAASALNHPNILTVFDVGSHQGTPWLATEFIDGPTIRQRLQTETVIPVSDAIDITMQLLSALEAAHGANIVHRDIKPENVMVRQDGIVKLVDFSLAKSLEIRSLTDTAQSGTATTGWNNTTGAQGGADDTVFAGTVRYMSPEQALQLRVDARTDLWSLGAVFYELLAGEPLFRGSDPLSILNEIQQLSEVPAFKKGLPAQLIPVLRKALQPDPKQRYQSAIAMLADLKAAQNKMQRRPPWLWWSIGAAALMTAIAGGLLWYRSQSSGLLRPAPVTNDTGYSAEPAVSADGRWIAFVSDRSGKGNLALWVQQAGSRGTATLVYDDGTDIHEPDFSPDGREIVFRGTSRKGSIRVVSREGGSSAPQRVIANYGSMPRFSPDGRWIVYMTARETDNASEVWVAPSSGLGDPDDPASTPPRRLAADFEDAHYPIWSEDGRSVLICGTRVSGDATQEHDWWVLPFPSGTPHKTGASGDGLLQGMRGVGHQLGPPVIWRNGFVYFSALGESRRNLSLWRAKLDFRRGGLLQERDQLTDETAMSDVQAKAGGDRIAFARGTLAIRVFEIPLHDANAGAAGGPPKLLHAAASDISFPHMNADGTLAAMQSGPGNRKIVVGKPGPGNELTPVARSSSPQDYPRWSRDGKRVAFRAMQNPKVPILIATPAVGEVVTACRDCGGPSDWSPDDTHILFEPGATVAHIGRLNVSNGEQEEYVLPRGNSLRGARYSPDGKWIAFHEELRRGLRQVQIVPVTARSAPNWIAITDGSHGDSSPAWSPDGNLLYFLSDRNGLRSPWAQRLDPVTKRPVGEPFPVYRFTESRRSVLQAASHREPFIGFEVYPGRIVLTLDEITSNVWSSLIPR